MYALLSLRKNVKEKSQCNENKNKVLLTVKTTCLTVR